MELAGILAALNVAGWLLMFLARNDWPRRAAWRLVQAVGRLSPIRRIHEKLLDIEHRLEIVADGLALAALRQEFAGNHAHAAICITDGDGHLTWASDNFLALAGASLDDVLSENWIAVVHQDDRGGVLRAWRSAVESRSNFAFDFRYSQPETGAVTWVSTIAKYARNPLNGRIAGWVCEVRRRPAPPAHEDCPAGHWVPPLNRSDQGNG